MALYNFNSNVLSAASVGNPPPTGTVLSAFGVNTISLSSAHIGLAFNSISTLANSLCSLNAFGSVFRIDRAYHNSIFALILPARRYTVFTYQSAYGIVPLSSVAVGSLSSPIQDVTTPEFIRLRLLGYI
jgi:hypothetical protein